MGNVRVLLQPAFILQRRKFRETSLLLTVLTKDFGIVSLIAKGVRRAKSTTAGLLLPFLSLKISYIGKSELKTLIGVEQNGIGINLPNTALYCGYYVNEIIGFLLHHHDPHPEVFASYHDCLQMLGKQTDIEQNLRFFELDLLSHIGYGLQLLVCDNNQQVVPDQQYYFDGEAALVASSHGYISGKTLQSLADRQNLHPKQLGEAKILMRAVLDFQLDGRTLKSRELLSKIRQQL